MKADEGLKDEAASPLRQWRESPAPETMRVSMFSSMFYTNASHETPFRLNKA